MKPPRLPSTHPDYILELEEEFETRLVELMDLAVDRGWQQSAIAAAVTSLARNYLRKLKANLDTDIAIAKAMKDGERVH